VDRQYGDPVIITDLGAETLARVPPHANESSGGYAEDWLQELIFKHPECLPIAEIDNGYSGLVPICRELPTPAGPVDVLYATPQGRLAIVEAKLWRNPEARRKVVGQILDYAKELSRWRYEDLQRQVALATKRKGNALFEIVSARSPGISEPQFVDEVSRSLRSGQFLMLIVGDGIREGVDAIAGFLEEYATLQFTFGLVELPVYKLSDGRRLVQPRVLAKTAIIKRIVVADKGDGLSSLEVAAEDEESREPSELEGFYLKFWTELRDELVLDDASQPLGNATKQGNMFFSMPPPAQSWLTVYFLQKKNEVGVFLTFLRGAFGDRAYDILLAEREQIEKEIGISIEWKSDGSKHVIRNHHAFPDVRAEQHRGEIKSYLKDTINRFVSVFRPRLARIVSEL
jgi:hypothetical protein